MLKRELLKEAWVGTCCRNPSSATEFVTQSGVPSAHQRSHHWLSFSKGSVCRENRQHIQTPLLIIMQKTESTSSNAGPSAKDQAHIAT